MFTAGRTRPPTWPGNPQSRSQGNPTFPPTRKQWALLLLPLGCLANILVFTVLERHEEGWKHIGTRAGNVLSLARERETYRIQTKWTSGPINCLSVHTKTQTAKDKEKMLTIGRKSRPPTREGSRFPGSWYGHRMEAEQFSDSEREESAQNLTLSRQFLERWREPHILEGELV